MFRRHVQVAVVTIHVACQGDGFDNLGTKSHHLLPKIHRERIHGIAAGHGKTFEHMNGHVVIVGLHIFQFSAVVHQIRDHGGEILLRVLRDVDLFNLVFHIPLAIDVVGCKCTDKRIPKGNESI